MSLSAREDQKAAWLGSCRRDDEFDELQGLQSCLVLSLLTPSSGRAKMIMTDRRKSLICPLKHIFSSPEDDFFNLLSECEKVQSSLLYRRDIKDGFDWPNWSLAQITQQNFELAFNCYCWARGLFWLVSSALSWWHINGSPDVVLGTCQSNWKASLGSHLEIRWRCFQTQQGRLPWWSNEQDEVHSVHTCWVENWLTICCLLSPCSDHVCHKPLLWPGCVGRQRSPADHRWGGRSNLGGGPCTRCCLHHMHRHCHPPLQEVRISNEKLFVEQQNNCLWSPNPASFYFCSFNIHDTNTHAAQTLNKHTPMQTADAERF